MKGLFGIGEIELLDLERELRRDGLLKSGRPGPGGGTPATPETIAVLLVALLVGIETRRGIGHVSEVFGLFPLRVGGTCQLTGASCFIEALATILASPETGESPETGAAAHVIRVEVVRNLNVATIEYFDGDEVRVSKFGVNTVDVPPILSKKTIEGDTLGWLATHLALVPDEGQVEAE